MHRYRLHMLLCINHALSNENGPNEPKNHQTRMSDLKQDGYKVVPMPKDLRDELREDAAKQKVRLHEATAKWVRNMIAEQWRPDYYHSTVYVFTKLEQDEMLAMEKLAFSCNMSMAGYVRAYREHQKRNNDRV